jgi:hypothetical protein
MAGTTDGAASWLVGLTGTTVCVWMAVVVTITGIVRVTVVAVSAQTSQTVTVVVKPSGHPLV